MDHQPRGQITGMLAFRPTHEANDIGALVACIGELPKVEPEEYEAVLAAAGTMEAQTPAHTQDNGHAAAQNTGSDGRP